MSAHYAGDDVLGVMEKYVPNRNSVVEKLIVHFLEIDKLDRPARILEFGAGRGEFVRRIHRKPNVSLVAVDSDSSYVKKLSSDVQAFASIDEVPGELDSIYLIDVLEHLEDDNNFLLRFHDKLKPGGKLFVYVPARMELYSSFDKSIGHYRRYTKMELKKKVVNAGFVIKTIRYHELLGYFALLLNKQIMRNDELNIKMVRLYDNILVPLTNFIEKFISPPFGKSLYVSAIRKN